MSREDEGQVTTQLLQVTVWCREHSPAEAAAAEPLADTSSRQLGRPSN